MSTVKGSYRNPKGEYDAYIKGSSKKPPIGNYSSAYCDTSSEETSESKPETGLGKRVSEG
ncbi:hypothetical protein HYT25_04955 [Candidatus Pacearchaeota archaeon]|nr:hypothetical protein [Candidatus Pacearchaeota archaeon]